MNEKVEEIENEIEIALKKPFPVNDIQWRVQRSGISKSNQPWAMVLAYVDARAVMDRLDEVYGINGWEDNYEFLPSGVLCRLTVTTPYGETVTKVDGSPETAIEGFKGGISKALVRTASKLGIGRYLYSLSANFADCSFEKRNGWNKAKDSDSKKWFFWNPPPLPIWALPQQSEEPPRIDYKKRVEQIKTIRAALSEKTQGMEPNDKMDYLKKITGLADFGMLAKKDNEFLSSIINKLKE